MRSLVPYLVASSLAAVDPAFDPQTAEAVVRINDARWVEREATRMSAAMGRDPSLMRAAIATTLYHARSLEGIDTTRPAMIAWRSGSAPLIAVIPLKDRRRFLDDFGVMPSGESPLVRTGDRDGTTVWTQNAASGLREYRVLVANETAFLGRSVEECRALAARPPLGQIDQTVPLTVTMTGAFLAHGPTILEPPPLPWTMPRLGWLDLDPLVAAGRAALEDGTTRLTWEVRPIGQEGDLRVLGTLTAKPDSALGAFVSNQHDGASRLVEPLRTPETALMVWGSLAWQGQPTAFGAAASPTMRTAFGPAWIPAVDESWRSWWSLWERGGDFAWALEAVSPQRYFATTVSEQPRAVEQAGTWNTVAGAVTGIPGTSDGRLYLRAGRLEGKPFEQAIFAGDRQVIAVDAFGGVAARPVAEQAANRLAVAGRPAAVTAIIAGWCDMTRLARFSPHRDPDTALPPAVVSFALHAPASDTLTWELQAPLQGIAAVLARSTAAVDQHERRTR
jgi:hypothetical protein